KVLEINKQEMVKKLLALDAVKVFEGDIQATCYDFKDNSILHDNSLLRLRKKGDKNFLTFKKVVSSVKAKVVEEIETEVKDFNEMQEILLNMNLKSFKDFTKKRTSFKIDETLFEIDEYKELPVFMEIEAPDIKTIDYYVEKLGVDKTKVKTWILKKLFEHYNVKNDFARL
ncbi:MAG: CYTH domain-containing protein, partial [archaeon]